MKKLRESVEKTPSQPAQGSSPSREQGGGRPEEIERIIERLRSKEGASQSKERSSLQDIRLAELKARIEGRATVQKLDFSKVALHESGKKQPFFSEGTLSFVGNFYSVFEWPVSAVASLFSKLPLAGSLESNLAAADLPISIETYLVASSVFSILVGIMVLVASFAASAMLAPQIAFISVPIAAVAFTLAAILSLFYPSTVAQERARKINRELPFALRHLSSQVRAGVSFHRALRSVASADYGLLSVEFKRVLRDLDKGSSTEVALSSLAGRTKSQGLRKAMVQIIRALKTGGNLSEIIGGIAEDVAFESRMLVRDFVETLNIVNVLYVMVGVVAPVIITILSAVTQLPGIGSGVPFSLIVLIFFADLMAMLGMVYVIKRMEPA